MTRVGEAPAVSADPPHCHGLHGSTRHKDRTVLGLAVLLGLLVGLAGTAFHVAVGSAVGWPARLAPVIGAVPAAIVGALGCAAMLMAAVLLVRRFAPEAAGSGVQEIEGALENLRFIRWRRVLPVKFVGGVLALSSGLVAGREGPTIHIGASIAQALDELWRLDELDRKGLLAAGAAAGLAAAFNAPLAAVLFVLEETRRQFHYTFRSYSGVILAACMSTVVTSSLTSLTPDLAFAVVEPPVGLLPAFLVLGALMGAVGVLFNAALLGAAAHTARLRGRAIYIPAAAVGMFLGAAALFWPEATGGGDALVTAVVGERNGFWYLLLLAAVRLAMTALSYATGAPGGIFAPMLALSTVLGLAVAELGDLLALGLGEYGAALAVAAMGALFAASVRAPLVGAVLALELTGAFGLALPVLACCVVGNLTAAWLGGRPIYEELLERTLARTGQSRPPERDGAGLAG